MIDDIARTAAVSMRAEGARIAASLDRPDWLDRPATQRASNDAPTPVAHRYSPLSGRRTVTRPRRVGMVLAAVVVIVGGVVIVKSITQHRSPANIQPSNTQPIGTGPTTPTTPTSSSTETTATSSTTPAGPVDLGGDAAGLLLPPEALPAGWFPIAADPLGPGDGGGLLGVRWMTWAGRYASDRATLDETMTVQVDDGIVDGALSVDAQAVDVRSTTGRLAPQGLEWVENGNTVLLSTSAPRSDLVEIADGLTIRADGAFDFGSLPASFEQIAVVTGRDSFGAGFYTGYASGQSVDGDGAVFSVRAVLDAGAPAEVTLAAYSGYGTPTAYATEINGHRAIVVPGLAPTIVWDEPDGTQISVSSAPLEGDGTMADRTQTAIDLASALRRASTQQWADVIDQIPANAAAFESSAYMADQLAPLQLTIAGPSRRLSGKRQSFVVPVQDAAGTVAGSCEFMLRQLITCTTPEQQTGRAPSTFAASEVGNGYVRVIAGSAATRATLSFQDTKVKSPADLTPLAFTAASAGVAYLAVRGDPTTMCLTFEDANGPVTMTADTTNGAIPACP